MPLSKIEIQDGSLELLNIKNTKKYFSTSKSIKNFQKYYFEGDLGDLFLSKLNLSLNTKQENHLFLTFLSHYNYLQQQLFSHSDYFF